MPLGFKHILYATDLSENASHASLYAASIASQYGAELTALHVVSDILQTYGRVTGLDMSAYYDPSELEQFHHQSKELAANALAERIRETCDLAGAEADACPFQPANVLVEFGDPAERIAELANEGDYDLVIIGAHGQGLLSELILGSVANSVIRRCRKPVLVIRLPGEP